MSMDVVIGGATVVDGSGAAPFRADVGVRDGKITAIGDLATVETRARIHAANRVLTPGFVDVHSHADMTICRPDHAKVFEPLIRQGITTFVGGNCGVGMTPVGGAHEGAAKDFMMSFLGRDDAENLGWRSLGEFLAAVEGQGSVINMAMLAPHGIIRIAVSGLSKRLARADELREMARILEQCLDEGALGMSTGLQYFPGSQSDTGELLHLARSLRKYDAAFTAHLRSYTANTIDQAIDEVKQVARATGIHGQVSHLFWVPHTRWAAQARIVHAALVVGSKIYERVKVPIPLDRPLAAKLEKLGREIADGLRLGVDAMPTSAGFTHLLAFFPPWVLEGDRTAIMARLQDPAARRRMRRDIEQGESRWPHREDHTWSMNFFKLLGWDGIYIMSLKTAKNKHLEGLSLAAVAASRKKDPLDATIELLLEENVQILVFETGTYPGDDFVERSLLATMSDANVAIATDSILLGHGKSSHLFYDCYPKFLSRYAGDGKALSFAEGIRKCTSLPASQLGIRKRGLVRLGHWADLVILDPQEIRSHSTFARPDVFPDGVEYVLVNGKIILDPNGYHPEPRPGRVVRRQDS